MIDAYDFICVALYVAVFPEAEMTETSAVALVVVSWVVDGTWSEVDTVKATAPLFDIC